MKREEWFQSKWFYLKRFALIALAGIVLVVLSGLLKIKFLMLGLILIVPLIFWLVMVPLLHWKDRYIGEKSTLWGALILIETSGWSKIVYWFRHVIPDWNRSGRYSDTD